ncbi:MAG: GSU2403 family nucleotidyltransferase fold protein [Desulfuromonadales bacterium]
MMRSDAISGRVLDHLAQSGLFRLGAVLVGTHAFNLLGAVLGVTWKAGQQTEDIDIASDLHVAVPGEEINLPETLARLEMGFLPVPALNPRHPATSFKVRGQRLRVDLLCPAGNRKINKPLEIKALHAAAHGGVLVNVPDPSRFALHKMIVANERDAAWQTKVDKDLLQAGLLLEVLLDERPGDLLLIREEILQRGWKKHLITGLNSLQRRHPRVAEKAKDLFAG